MTIMYVFATWSFWSSGNSGQLQDRQRNPLHSLA